MLKTINRKKFGGSIIKTLLVKPVFVAKQKGLVLKRLAWGFGGKGLKDDILVDNINISKKDMIYYYESSTTKKNEKPLAGYARVNGYKVVSLDTAFNINKCYYRSIRNMKSYRECACNNCFNDLVQMSITDASDSE